MVNIASLVDVYGVRTYVDPLLYFRTEYFGSWIARELSLKKDHFIRCYITKLDEEIFTEKPITTPNIFKKKTEDDDLIIGDFNGSMGYDVEDDWNKEKWDKLQIKYFDKARLHKYCVVQLYNDEPHWRVFTDREITEIEYNENDVPIGCTVEWSRSLPKSKTFRNFKEELEFFDRDRNPEGTARYIDFGEYDLEDKWTLLINLRHIQQDMFDCSAKAGGWNFTKYGETIQDEDKQDYINAMDVVSAGRGVGAKGSVIEDIKTFYPIKPEFTIQALEEARRMLSGACRLPLSFFRSEKDTAGAFSVGSGDAMDELKVNKKKRYIFSQFKDVMIDLIYIRWLILIKEIEPYIEEYEQEEITLNENKNKQEKVVENA